MAQLKPSPNNSIFSKRRDSRGSPGSPCSSSCCRIRSNNNYCIKKIRLVCLGVNGEDVGHEREISEKRRKILFGRQRRSHAVVPFCSSSTSSSCTSSSTVELVEDGGGENGNGRNAEGQLGYLVSEFGWKVRRLVEVDEEMREVVQVQAEAFHVPMALFDDFFFEFFKAEVLSGLLYKIRNSPPDRYACLVAKPADASDTFPASLRQLVGVVDVTVQRNEEVLQHLEGADEYVYVSGIAVFKEFRRQKVGTVLLKACDIISHLWRYEYLALRVYDDDSAARKLYTNAGYRAVSKDPAWMTTWIGRKRRVLMIKRSNSSGIFQTAKSISFKHFKWDSEYGECLALFEASK